MAVSTRVRFLRTLPLVLLLALLAAPQADAKQLVRIVGGGPTPIASVPWQVGILFAGEPRTWNAQFCGGTIRDAYTVITAAHCVDGYSGSFLDVLAGTNTLSTSSYNNSGGQRIRVAQVDVHPGYGLDHSNDVALLTLTAPITTVAAAALPPISPAQALAIDSPADQFLVSGWGSTTGYNPGQSVVPHNPTTLQSVTVPFVADDTCAARYPTLVKPTMLCAGQANKDSCQGDSGGPLAYNTGGSWTLAGIVSWGAGCGADGFPGVYTEVASASVRDFVTGAVPPTPVAPQDEEDLSDYGSDWMDFERPVIKVVRRQCVRRTCNLLLSIRDGEDGSGIDKVRAFLRTKLKYCSAAAKAKRRCLRTRKLNVRTGEDDGLYSVTATRLARGRQTITIIASDNGDNSARKRVTFRSR